MVLKCKQRFHLASIGVFCALGAVSPNSQALSYGIFEARALAMGGATVAVANTDNAHFYNPALLAFHDTREEDSKDGRVFFPSITAQVSDAIKNVVEIADDELDDRLQTAVDGFNAVTNTQTAETVLNATRELNDAIGKLANENMTADIFAGISVTEPSKREGGSFYIGARILGGGSSNVTDSDLNLLGDYIEAMEFVVSGGSSGALHPELFGPGGTLIDPSNLLSTTASAGGAAIVEWGLAASKEYTLMGRPIAFGITPKIMRVDAYSENLDFASNDFELNGSAKSHISLNADVGIATQLSKYLRAGLAVKDILAKDFATENNDALALRPRARLGLAYMTSTFSAGIDFDITKNQPLINEAETKDISLGLEWTPFRAIDFRVGYSHDTTKNRGDLLSGGISYQFSALIIDLSYAQSSDLKGLSFQLGLAF